MAYHVDSYTEELSNLMHQERQERKGEFHSKRLLLFPVPLKTHFKFMKAWSSPWHCLLNFNKCLNIAEHKVCPHFLYLEEKT